MELMYCLQARLVRVTRKATMPPKRMATIQVPTASSTVFQSGVHRLALASLLVKRSM